MAIKVNNQVVIDNNKNVTAADISADQITASGFFGDGSNLTGIVASNVPTYSETSGISDSSRKIVRRSGLSLINRITPGGTIPSFTIPSRFVSSTISPDGSIILCLEEIQSSVNNRQAFLHIYNSSGQLLQEPIVCGVVIGDSPTYRPLLAPQITQDNSTIVLSLHAPFGSSSQVLVYTRQTNSTYSLSQTISSGAYNAVSLSPTGTTMIIGFDNLPLTDPNRSTFRVYQKANNIFYIASLVNYGSPVNVALTGIQYHGLSRAVYNASGLGAILSNTSSTNDTLNAVSLFNPFSPQINYLNPPFPAESIAQQRNIGSEMAISGDGSIVAASVDELSSVVRKVIIYRKAAQSISWQKIQTISYPGNYTTSSQVEFAGKSRISMSYDGSVLVISDNLNNSPTSPNRSGLVYIYLKNSQTELYELYNTIQPPSPVSNGEFGVTVDLSSQGEYLTITALSNTTSTAVLRRGEVYRYSLSADIIALQVDQSNGNVGIGNNITLDQKLVVEGNIKPTGTIIDSSNSGGNYDQVLGKDLNGQLQWQNYTPIKAWGVIHIPSGVQNTPSRVGILTSSPGVLVSIVPYSSIGGISRTVNGIVENVGVYKIDFPALSDSNYCVIVSSECRDVTSFNSDGDHIVNVVYKTNSSIWVSNIDTGLMTNWVNNAVPGSAFLNPQPITYQSNTSQAIANGAIHFMIIGGM